jgi:hypothetical protein
VKTLKAYAFAHQEWMLREAWGPLWRAVLRLVASARAVPDGKASPVFDLSAGGEMSVLHAPLAGALGAQ